ncbi:MAG: PAS domain S-box protein [Deltaproteobacteria bacterium]|nr:PAS domain S-box protein [Deltaproteobacteria bacterium]
MNLRNLVGCAMSVTTMPKPRFKTRLEAEIRERQHAEEALRQSEERYCIISHAISDYAFALHFAPDGALIVDWLTDSFTKITGYPVQEVLGNPHALHRYIHSDDLERVTTTLTTLPPGQPASYQFRLVTKDGEVRWLQSSAWAVADATGSVTHVYGATQDITERRQAEEAFSFRFLFAGNPLPMWVVDADTWQFLEVNDAAVAQYGYAREEFLQMRLTDIRPPEEVPRLLAALKQQRPVLYHGGEWRHRRKDGKLMVAEIISHALEFAGHNAILTVAQDVTLRKHMEEQLRQSEERYRALAQEREQQLILSDRRVALGDLAAFFAHEFNNPLGIILGFAQDLLSEARLDDPFRRRLEIIEHETQRCKRLVRDLVDFVRPAPKQLVWTDLRKLIDTSLTLVATPLRKQQIQTAIMVQPALPRLHVDAQQLQQVLLNLFFNAIESMPQGGSLSVQAAVSSRLAETNGRRSANVMIRVGDSGPGIAAEDHEKIFRPFFTTKTKGGMGLGLSICQSIIQAHEGRITVDSQPGHGATFSIILPLTTADETEAVDA